MSSRERRSESESRKLKSGRAERNPPSLHVTISSTYVTATGCSGRPFRTVKWVLLVSFGPSNSKTCRLFQRHRLKRRSAAGASRMCLRGRTGSKSWMDWQSFFKTPRGDISKACVGDAQADLGRNYRGAHYPPHSHSTVTTHLILRGEFTITYPDDPEPTKQTFGPGARIDVDAGRVHEVWMGSSGCTYVIGE